MLDTQGKILALLKEKYGEVKYYLQFSNPLELMVAAILSAQTRDTVVNAATPLLFASYKSAQDYALASIEDIIAKITKISFARKKAAMIQESCKILVERYSGEVPQTMLDLSSLPGVGRKTANAILAHGFQQVCGIPVDTHVIRLSRRLGLTDSPYPEKIEKDLCQTLPPEEWPGFGLRLKAHGKAFCKPRPLCSSCFLKDLCPKKGVDPSS